MTVTNHVYADIAVKQDALIRKALDGSVYLAEMSATLPTSLTVDGEVTGTPTLALLPDGYTDLGLISDDGAQFSEKVDSADITSWGRVEPSRRDITSDVVTLQVVCQETKLQTISAYTGVSAADFTPDATTGELHVAKPTRPSPVYYRVLAIGVDQTDDGEIYVATLLPRASVTDKGDMAYQSGDDGLYWDITFTAYTDDTAGFACQYLFGGAGWKALLAQMGLSGS